MAHDNADSQSQDFRLASRPVRKFDLDEALQGHPRFDSLVEAEDFLALQGQANNWIEDFTSVGSEMKFRSTGGQSYLISRPESVWSEATSSESMEMLLKSVSEDRPLENIAICKEADVIDGLNANDDQNNTCLSRNVFNAMTVDSICTAPLLPVDKSQERLPLTSEDVPENPDGLPDTTADQEMALNKDVFTVVDKTDDASPAGQKSATETLGECSSVKKLIHNESGDISNYTNNSSTCKILPRNIESPMLKSTRNIESPMLKSTKSTRNIESPMLKSTSAYPSTAEQDCGSPTVISGIGQSQEGLDRGGNRGRADDLCFVSSEANANSDKVKFGSHYSNEGTTNDDRSFTFKVGVLADVSEKAFPTIRSFEPCQISKEDSVERLVEAEEEPQRTIANAPVGGNNTTTSAEVVLNQYFTDLQQVQLRAQILVYGSLIQGTRPDEAWMESAFGKIDGGRISWEGVWRAYTEGHQIQKSPFNGYETPSHSHSGVHVSEHAAGSSSLRINPGLPDQSASKAGPSAMIYSALPLPSPVRSVSSHDALHSHLPKITHLDFNQAHSPLPQSSQINQCTGKVDPLSSQFPRPGLWVHVSQNSAVNVSSQHPTVSAAETVQVAPVRGSFVPPTALLTAPDPPSASVTPVVQIDSRRKMSGNDKSPTSVRKSGKRKIDPSAHEEFQPNISSTSLVLSSNSPSQDASRDLVLAATSMIAPTHCQIARPGNSGQRAISEETGSQIEQARLQAEDASADAASAVRHSQATWDHIITQKNSGLISEVDAKLAFAAIAASAAASVAKAAAAAAKVAADASLQAKLMADEVLNSVRTGSLSDISENTPLDMSKSFARLTPCSILKGKDKAHGSSSVLSVARETARRRVEAASAASKRAENMDAIVRAAELAADAVSQAGSIIAMGEPLPFTISDLVEAGTEARWTDLTYKPAKAKSLPRVEEVGSDGANSSKSVEKLNEQPPNIETRQKNIDDGGAVSCSGPPVQSEEQCKGNESYLQTDGHELDNLASNTKENIIQKGCLTEVLVNIGDLRGVWFSAHVLDVKDGKAYICYDKLVSSEGVTLLKEWISLEGEDGKAPIIRLAHPVIVAKCAGTRKRTREAAGNCTFDVGDRVDAWMRDGWWEGIVTEKCQESEAKFTVHFPDGGNSSTFRAWNLRPSLVWEDGHWIESSCARGKAIQPPESDKPREKRQKLCSLEPSIESAVDGKGINIATNNIPAESKKDEESTQIMSEILSAKDRTRAARKNVKVNNKSDALRVRSTGKKKERSGVVIGVPKPGKKTKLVEVSKHYANNQTDKSRDGNDSTHIQRNTSEVDPKGKSARDFKAKLLKSMKTRTIQTRSKTEKENQSVTNSSNSGESMRGSVPNVRAISSNARNSSEKKNQQEVGSSSSLGATNIPGSAPSEKPVAIVSLSSKKASPTVEPDLANGGKPLSVVAPSKKASPAVEPELLVKEKLTSSVDKSGKPVSAVASSKKASSSVEPDLAVQRKLTPSVDKSVNNSGKPVSVVPSLKKASSAVESDFVKGKLTPSLDKLGKPVSVVASLKKTSSAVEPDLVLKGKLTPTVDKSAKPVAVVASSSKNASPTVELVKGKPVAVLASSSKKASPALEPVKGKPVAVLDSSSKKASPAVEPVKGKPVAVLDSSSKASPASVDKSTKRKIDGYDDSGKTGSVTPLRKSVRTIQPTSKLLEGLQTSSSVSRIPSFSHAKAQPKATPRRGKALKEGSR